MSASTTVHLNLKTPLQRDSAAPFSWSNGAFWRRLGSALLMLAAVLVGSYLLGHLWLRMELPNFEIAGSSYPWIFPLQIAAILFALDRIFFIFSEEKRLRLAKSRAELIERFEAEAFPFLRAELSKIENGSEFEELPSRDWLAHRMLSADGEGANWGSRCGESECFIHFSARLEKDGQEVRFAAKYPRVYS